MRKIVFRNGIIKRILSVVIGGAMLLTMLSPSSVVLAASETENEPQTGAHGSGSYHLNKVAEDSRFYTEYYVAAASGKKYTTADITRRTTICVYAKAGEVILFGSSVSDSEISVNNEWTKSLTGADIVITTPSNVKIPYDVIAPGKEDGSGNVRTYGYGYIANPIQEQYGPMVNHEDEKDAEHKYYVPLTYEVQEDGVYMFEFHSKTGYNDGSSPTKVKAGSNQWNQKNTTVAAWDVTVLGKESGTSKWEVKSGRAWADYLALTTGDGSAVADLDVHVLTHDGYVYKVDFNRAAPFGFIFFANNTGFMSATSGEGTDQETHYPIYHSFYDSTNDLDNMKANENILLHKPNVADTATEETYKIFFNRPNDDLQGVEYVDSKDGKKVQIKVNPDDKVTIKDLKFKGIEDNISHSGHGGAFSFWSSGEAMIAVTLDLRKAIFESEITLEEYDGSGLVELIAPAQAGDNVFYWDGKDTDGIVVPAGIYGNQNVYIATEIKRGEIHFPVIDMEGLTGGLQIERLNKSSSESETSRISSAYNLYYNNNPLAYGTIEGKDYKKFTDNGYNQLSDGTKSFNISSEKGGVNFFKNDNPISISTLKKDDKEYLCQKLFNKSYSDASLTAEEKEVIDAEFGKEFDTFHFEPVKSNESTMSFSSSGYNGGGNQAGIDAWTYYSQDVNAAKISFAVLDPENMGVVRGQIFYDGNRDSEYISPKINPSSTDYPLANMKVRLIGKDGKPLTHEKSLPCFDEYGYFQYNEDGTVKHETRPVTFDAITDVNGNYRFTGVPYDKDGNEEYYVQVMLTEPQTELLRYTCTTSAYVKANLKSKLDGTYFLTKEIGTDYGADGNKLTDNNTDSKVYGYRYVRTSDDETAFDVGNTTNTQKVILNSSSTAENGIHVAEFKKIGYCTAVPEENQRDYKITKKWGLNSQGESTHKISDGLTVELWVWNEENHTEDEAIPLTRRTGTLLDTQVLDEGDGWTYTWKNLDNRLQYYVLEYYTKKKDNGEIIYNDRHEPRLVLIGGTMPMFDKDEIPIDTKTGQKKEIYGFNDNLGEYPTEEIPAGSGVYRIPIQKYEAVDYDHALEHVNSITKQEKLVSIDNNARQYNVTYRAIEEDGGKTNTIYLTNSQMYDDRTYYVWLDHQTILPDLISQTYVEHTSGEHQKKSHSLTLVKDRLLDEEKDEWSVKGLSVSSIDAASSDNTEGNATNAFRIHAASGSSVLFTATNHGNYKTGIGTRTYQVKYVTKSDTRAPVAVKVSDSGKLVLAEDGVTEVENNSGYSVYSWFMTIHVYDVKPDGVIKYNPEDGDVILQEALAADTHLQWTKNQKAENDIEYSSNDPRTKGILQNDTFRLPLYKNAVDPNMGSCADVVGIAWAGAAPVSDVTKLKYSDTYDSRYGATALELAEDDDTNSASLDGTAQVAGDGGMLTVALNTARSTQIDRTQDHANYAQITFSPKMHKAGISEDPPTDVFYYKIVVFSEDSTYQFRDYDELDATEGVVMYTYFTMQSTALPETPPSGEETPPGGEVTPPGGEETPPGGEETPPGGEETPPGGEETPPGGEETPPGGEVTPPGGEETPPEGEVTPPGGEMIPPSGEETPPGGEVIPPSGEETPPGGEVIPPSGEETPPGGEVIPPSGGETPPGGEVIPPSGEEMPPGGEIPSISEETTTDGTMEREEPSANVLSEVGSAILQTGDPNNVIFWMGLGVFGFELLIHIGIRRRHKEQ